MVTDVRSTVEFRAGHLTPAVNIPLAEIKTALPRRVKDKKQVQFRHGWQRNAQRQGEKPVKTVGYENIFNVGSSSRAGRKAF